MQFNLSSVELSYRDKLAGVKLPTEPSPELAELIGILAGDGCVASYGTGDNYRISVAGHIKDDFLYLQYVAVLLKNLFNADFKLRIRETNSCIYLDKRSQGISQFLASIGYGKVQCIMKIPDWIWDEDNFTAAFIRGLFDTDGSLCLKRNHGKYKFYPVIDITSKDESIIRKLAKWAKCRDVSNHIGHYSYRDKRTNKIYSKFRLQISGYNNCQKWISLIGTSNPTKKEKMGVTGFEPVILP